MYDSVTRRRSDHHAIAAGAINDPSVYAAFMTNSATTERAKPGSMHRDRLRRAAAGGRRAWHRRAAHHAVRGLCLPARLSRPGHRAADLPGRAGRGRSGARPAAARGAARASRARRPGRRGRDPALGRDRRPDPAGPARRRRRAAGRGPGPDVGPIRAAPAGCPRSRRDGGGRADHERPAASQEPRRGRSPARRGRRRGPGDAGDRR